MRRTNVLTEGAMSAALFVILLLLALYIPVLSIVAVFCLPLPMIVFIVRNGYRSSLMLWAVMSIVAVLITGLPGLLWALLFGGGGFATGWLYLQKKSAFGILLGGSLAYTLGLIAVFIIISEVLGIHLIEQNQQLIQNALDQAEKLGESSGSVDSSALEQLSETIEMLRYFAPIMFVMMGTIIALVTQLVSVPVLKRLGFRKQMKAWLPFRDWSFPKSFIWYYLVILIIDFIQDFSVGSSWFIIYYNIFMLFSLMMVIQGFSFLFFYCYHKNMHQSVPILIMVGVFLFSFIFPFTTLISFVGILDLGLNLRQRVASK